MIKEVKKWIDELVYLLCIPASKQKEIKKNVQNEMEQMKRAMSYWMNNDPLVSWKRLIIALDGIGETKLADTFRFNAEPPTGVHINFILVQYLQYNYTVSPWHRI